MLAQRLCDLRPSATIAVMAMDRTQRQYKEQLQTALDLDEQQVDALIAEFRSRSRDPRLVERRTLLGNLRALSLPQQAGVGVAIVSIVGGVVQTAETVVEHVVDDKEAAPNLEAQAVVDQLIGLLEANMHPNTDPPPDDAVEIEVWLPD